MKKNMVLTIVFYSIVALIFIGLIYWFGIRPCQNREEMFGVSSGNFTIVADKTDSGEEFDNFPMNGKTMVTFLWKGKKGEINKQYIRFQDIDFEFTDTEHPFVNFNIEKNDFSYTDIFNYDVKYDSPADVVNKLTLWGGHKLTINMAQDQYNYYFSDIPIGDYQY